MTFHPNQQVLLWTSIFVFTDKRTQCVTKLWHYGERKDVDHLVTKLKYDDFEFSLCGKYIYSHPPRNGQCGFWDRFKLADIPDISPTHNGTFSHGDRLSRTNTRELAPQAVNRIANGDIYLSGRSHAEEVVGIIPRNNGEGAVEFLRKTILRLPPTVRYSHGCVRLVVQTTDQRAKGYFWVLLHNEDGRTLDSGNAEYDARPIIISVRMEELMRREMTKARMDEISDIFLVMVQKID